MPYRARIERRFRISDVSASEMNLWKQMVRQLPEVRLEKVLAARRLQASGEYDFSSDHLLTVTSAQVALDLGIDRP